MAREVATIQNSPTVSSPANLLQIALEKGVDFDQLKQLMDLQERWEKKEAYKSFNDALSLFQSKCPPLKKNKTANVVSQRGSFKYKYAELGHITEQIKGLLYECGLSYRWTVGDSNGKIEVTCFVSHRDGHTEQTTMQAAADTSGAKNDIQQKGSTLTYLQRYTLIGALGLSTADEDTDAKGQMPNNNQGQQCGTEKMTDQEIEDQWREKVSQINRRIELNALYAKSRKAVESNKAVQKIFKEREAQLKETEGNNQQKIDLP